MINKLSFNLKTEKEISTFSMSIRLVRIMSVIVREKSMLTVYLLIAKY